MNKEAIHSATNEELVRRFEETAIVHRELRSADESNRAFDEGVAIWAELRGRGKEAVDLFLTLLSSPKPAVRMNSAGLSLSEIPERAEPVLEQLTHEPRSLGISARMTLSEWRAGRLKPLA
jgi:hypothetical protein